MLARINEFLIGYNKTKTRRRRKRKTLFDQKKGKLRYTLIIEIKFVAPKKMGGKKWIYVEISEEIILKRNEEKQTRKYN